MICTPRPLNTPYSQSQLDDERHYPATEETPMRDTPVQSQQSRAAAKATPAVEKRGRRRLMKEIMAEHQARPDMTVAELVTAFAQEILNDVE